MMSDDHAPTTSILVVDDNPAAGKTLQLVLGTEGYHADLAGGADEALQMAAEKAYDAALIDISLPDRSGIEVLGDLKQRYPELVGIMVTGNASTENTIEALNRGATGYLRKPVDVQQMFGMLRSALDKKRLEEENWRMLRRLSLLHAIGAKVSVGLDPQTTLRDSVGLIVSLLDLAGCAIWWLGAEETPDLATEVGLPEPLIGRLTPSVADLQIQLAADPALRDRPWFEVTEALDGDDTPWCVRLIPLRGPDRTIGCMAVGGRPQQMESMTDEAEVLGALASQIGVAMENMRLFDDLRGALEQLKEAQAQIVQSEKLSAVGRVVSGVAHELNNPLMVILGYASLIRDGVEGAEIPDMADRIHSHAERAKGIIQGLLSFARRERTVLRPTDLGDVIEASIEGTECARGDRVRLNLDLPESLPILAGDPGGLQQVLTNIMSNACQAMGETGGTLTLAVEVADDTVTIRIRDTGPGIPEDVLPRIFDPFFTTKGVGQGTGLGLSVSHGIISDHGGYISADNAPDGGAMFTIRLPIREPEPAAPAASQEAFQDAPWLQPTGGE